MNPQPHLLALVPRGTLPVEIDALLGELSDKLKSQLGLDVCLTDSLSWYREAFDRCGNWDSWIWDSVTGRDYDTREYRFKGFVVVKSKALGRGNASITDLALAKQRVVLYFEPENMIETVTRVDQTDAEDLASGWTITTQPLRD